MKTIFTVVGCIAVVAVLGFAVAGCSNGSTHDHGDICYEHRLIYGIPVTGEVTDTRMTTIKAAIDAIELGPYASRINSLKNLTREIRIVANTPNSTVDGILSGGKWILQIPVALFDLPGSVFIIVSHLIDFIDENGIT